VYVCLCARAVYVCVCVCVCVCICASVRVAKISYLFVTFYVTVSTLFRYINGLKFHNKEDTSLGRVRFGIGHKLI
jgi:hypothetical protein